MFVYAGKRADLDTARSAIESALRNDGLTGAICISHWDHELDEWRQIDPPPAEPEQQTRDGARRDAEAVVTRTLVVSSGKLIRAELEQTMLAWAQELGVDCEIVEHPHLLTTQVGFTVTGPRRKVDEFSQGLRAEERATIRTDTSVMLSPL